MWSKRDGHRCCTLLQKKYHATHANITCATWSVTQATWIRPKWVNWILWDMKVTFICHMSWMKVTVMAQVNVLHRPDEHYPRELIIMRCWCCITGGRGGMEVFTTWRLIKRPAFISVTLQRDFQWICRIKYELMQDGRKSLGQPVSLRWHLCDWQV